MTARGWQRTIVHALLIAAAAVAAASCREAGPSEAAAAPAPAETTRPSVHGVHLDPAQLAQVRIEELSSRSPADAIKATGTVEFNADRIAKLLPPVAGQVQNLTVNVGDVVHRHNVLFVLHSREVAAAVADHRSSHKDLELAEKTFAMTQDLFEHQAASRIALEQSESELAKAQSKVVQAEESLQVLGLDPHAAGSAARVEPSIPVRTPIDGTVIERTVTNGQFVGAETTPLVTVADLSSVWVQGDIFERDLRRVAIGQRADVTTAAYPGEQFSAQVSRIASVVDAQTRTAKVRLLVANPGARLKPGMFAAVALALPESVGALTVPAKALFVESGRTFAYVQTGPGQFERREIETAPGGAERVRVVHGVKAGDHVVSDGVLLLRQLEADAATP